MSRNKLLAIGIAASLVIIGIFFFRLQRTSDIHETSRHSGATDKANWTIDVTQHAVVVDVVGNNGASVRLEAVDGGQRDVLTRLLHPDLGRYTVSTRVIDGQGIPWIMGMDEIPESWQEDYQRSLQIDVDPEKRAASSALIVDAKVALDSIPTTNFHALELLRESLR